MKRTKTWLTILLCLCMTVLLMPMTALADVGPGGTFKKWGRLDGKPG